MDARDVQQRPAGPVRAALGDAGDDLSREPYRFSLTTGVELADTDLYGVVYYGRYARLFDRAVTAYRRHLGLPPLGFPGHFPVVRRAAIDYHASARYGDELRVFLRTARIGETSMTLDLLVTRSAPGPPDDLVAAQIVTVGLDDDGAPSGVPPEVRAAIEAFEAAG